MTDYPFLNICFPEKEIFLRLGGHLTKTEITSAEKLRFHSLALKAFEQCHAQGRWEIFKVNAVREDGILLADNSFIASKDFARRCQKITHLWCGFATVGKAVTQLRDNSEKISEKALFDAVASECADAAMDMVQQLARQSLQRQNMVLAERRYSPGFGDMDLSVQKFFFERLALNELDILLSEAYYMIPEKSVTAFAGIMEDLG